MDKYTPIAVMTTSRNDAAKEWVLEIGAKNLARLGWLLLPWNTGRRPYVGGSDIDPAKLWGPNAGHGPKAGDPPDATRAADPVAGAKVGRAITGDVDDIQKAIIAKLNAVFAPAALKARQDAEFQGIAPDNYVSAFAGYHAVWYDASAASCKAGWHTHVDFGITVANASTAMKLQLEELIKWLDAN